MSYDRLAPTILSKAKTLFGSGNMGQNNWGGGARPPVPLLDGLDTRRCKILDPRLICSGCDTDSGYQFRTVAIC